LFDLRHKNVGLRDDQQDNDKVRRWMIKQNQMQALLVLQVHKNVLLFEQREVEQKDFDRLNFYTKFTYLIN
jgi:hypothetical protein